MPFDKGTRVEWTWGRGTGEGFVDEVFTEPVERTIKGARVRRNASEQTPAYLIRQDDGGSVLKSHSELREA